MTDQQQPGDHDNAESESGGGNDESGALDFPEPGGLRALTE